ncbi:ABC transporter substrate-binding protein [Desulfoplanes sp.]
MRNLSTENTVTRPHAVRNLCLLCLALFFVWSGTARAACSKTPPSQKVKAIVIGDRVVDIAYNLGVLPEAMSARVSLWPLAQKIKMVSQPLGCPRCITTKRKNAVPGAIEKRGIKRVIIEKSEPYCLYMPTVHPENVLPLLKGSDAKIEYVDFSNGIESAIAQTARIFGRESKGDELVRKYRKNMAMTKKMLPAGPLNKKVVVINGVYQASSGKSLLRVEAPGMYADTFMLKPLGCTNVGEAFNPKHAGPCRGHYMVKKSRKGFDLSPLIGADPDVIVAVGDALSVQKAIQGYAEKNPELKNVKAIKDMAVYGLPAYIDSSVIEYPVLLRKWSVALAR